MKKQRKRIRTTTQILKELEQYKVAFMKGIKAAQKPKGTK